ncbi:hypothetical protein [Streptomyces sp. URMC 123]|uniref:hypothetical protein n=1 Tax=Streptomyces sp. URMC 123 TaxID=3423403 RepID=UPI003F1C8311
MSHPDPNNPYSSPAQGQGQPYGQPQQGTGYPQQQGGYPQQPGQPYAPYPQGAGDPYGAHPVGDQVPTEMPGTLKAARIMLYVLGVIGVIFSLLLIALGAVDNEDFKKGLEDSGVSGGAIVGIGIVYLISSVLSIVFATKIGKGGSGTRIGLMVTGAVMIVASIFGFPLGLPWTVCGILVIVFAAKRDGAAWFNRPRG